MSLISKRTLNKPHCHHQNLHSFESLLVFGLLYNNQRNRFLMNGSLILMDTSCFDSGKFDKKIFLCRRLVDDEADLH